MAKNSAIVEKGDYQGRPVVVIKFGADDRHPFRFGPGKARRFLAAGSSAVKRMAEAVVSEADAIDSTAKG